MELVAGAAPLAIIPRIVVEAPVRRPWRRAALVAGASIATLLLAAALIHFFYRPLDVLWFVVQRRIGLG